MWNKIWILDFTCFEAAIIRFYVSLLFIIKLNNYVFVVDVLHNRHSLTVVGCVGFTYMWYVIRILYSAFYKSVIRRFNTSLLFIIELYDYMIRIDVLHNRHGLTVGSFVGFAYAFVEKNCISIGFKVWIVY